MEFKLIPTTSAQADNPNYNVQNATYTGKEYGVSGTINRKTVPFDTSYLSTTNNLPAGWEWNTENPDWESYPVFTGSDSDTYSPTRRWYWHSSDSNVWLISQGSTGSSWGNDYYSTNFYCPTMGNMVQYNTNFLIGGQAYALSSVGCITPKEGESESTAITNRRYYTMLSIYDMTYDSSNDEYIQNYIDSFNPRTSDDAWIGRFISSSTTERRFNVESATSAKYIYDNPSVYSNRVWSSMPAGSVLVLKKVQHYPTPYFVSLGHRFGNVSENYEGYQIIKADHTYVNYIIGDNVEVDAVNGRVRIIEPYTEGTLQKGQTLNTDKKYIYLYNPRETGDGWSLVFDSPATLSFWDVQNSIVGIVTTGTVKYFAGHTGSRISVDDNYWVTCSYVNKSVTANFYSRDKSFTEISDLGQEVKYTINSVNGPGFSKYDIIGGANYSMNVNSSNDLKIGDMSSGIVSWTSILDIRRYYSGGDLVRYASTTVSDSTKWNLYVKDNDDSSWVKLGVFIIKSEDTPDKTTFSYKAYDALYDANRSADKFLAASISSDDKYHWDRYKIGTTASSVTFSFNSNTTLSIPTAKDGNMLTVLDGQLRFKGVKQVKLHPYKVRAVRAKFMGNYPTGAIDSLDTPWNEYTLINGENVLIQDSDRFLAGYRAKINPTKLKEKLDELGIGYDEFNIVDYYPIFADTIIDCMEVVDERTPLWIRKTSAMSGTAYETFGNFIAPIYYRRIQTPGAPDRYEWTKIDNSLKFYLYKFATVSDYVPSSSSWVNYRGESSYIAPANRYPATYSDYYHDATSGRTSVNVNKAWALWGLSVEDFWCTNLDALSHDSGILSYEVLEDMYDYETAVGPIGNYSFFGYDSKIYQITSFTWLNDGRVSDDSRWGMYYSDNYQIVASEIDILETTDTSSTTNTYGEEKLVYSSSYWYYYLLTQVPGCSTLEDFYKMVMSMLGMSYENLTQSIKDLEYKNMLPKSGLTYRNLLEYIAEACGGFMCCNANGAVCVKNYIARDIYLNNTEYAKKESANYVVPVLDNLRLYTNEYNSKYFEFGLGANDYFITSNPLLYTIDDEDETLKDYIEEIYDEINVVEYTPMTIKTYDNPNNIKVGDVIWVDGKQTIVMSVDISTSGYTFKSTGSKERQRPIAKNTNDYTSVDGNYSNIDQSYENINLHVGDEDNNYRLIVTKTGDYTQRDDGEIIPISGGGGGGTSVLFSYDSSTNTLTITQ